MFLKPGFKLNQNVKVTNLDTNLSKIVKVNDTGPFDSYPGKDKNGKLIAIPYYPLRPRPGIDIDLSTKAYKAIGGTFTNGVPTLLKNVRIDSLP